MTSHNVPNDGTTLTPIAADHPVTPAEAVPLWLPIGDPAGIGPEIILKALAQPDLHAQAHLTVVGDRAWLETVYANLLARGVDPTTIVHPDHLKLLDIPIPVPLREQLHLGQPSVVSGDMSFRWLQAAIAATQRQSAAGIVTAPIAKSTWHEAGHLYPGQTEVLAQATQQERFGMLFVARSPHTGWTMRTLLATTHIPLRQVPTALTPELMTAKLALLVDCLNTDFGITQPTIAIPGLNPHSGEAGRLGTEEQDWLIPWLAEQRDRYPHATLIGPVPPDTLWVKAGQAWWQTAPQTNPPSVKAALPDAYLALYHDQGLIPVKLLGFDQAVNTTIGLPIVRTSPDHGTAFDIAAAGCADATSMTAAIRLAIALVQQRCHQLSASL